VRLVGKLENALQAGRFSDFLLTKTIDSKVEPDGDLFAIWVRDEQMIEQARELFKAFQTAPESSLYTDATNTAQAIRKKESQRKREIEKKTVDVRKSWTTPKLSQCRVTLILLITASAISVATNFGSSKLFYEFALVASPLEIIKSGQIWRLVTPIFLHMGWLHLLFNLYWTYQFGLLLEARLGSGKILILVFIVAIASNVAQFYASGPSFGGLSGLNYGFFGFLWIKSRFDPGSGLHIPENLVIFFMIWLVLCAVGLFGPVANTAHFVGLLAGAAVSGLPLMIRR
tara:strand:- start:9504 stop:10361 length:858 start_codon:yes stop_codon:yes gene_type:complete